MESESEGHTSNGFIYTMLDINNIWKQYRVSGHQSWGAGNWGLVLMIIQLLCGVMAAPTKDHCIVCGERWAGCLNLEDQKNNKPNL